LRVVDAGAAGAGETGRWGFLGGHLELHGFEADAEECAKLLAAAPVGATVHYYNAFLGRSMPRRTFLIAHAFNNTFYPTDYTWYARRRSSHTGPAVRLSEVYQIAKTLEVESISLDNWATHYGVSGVDYLKVDIEGAELELMQASPRIMAGVLGVSVDVTFHADWIGAPTFADVDIWMRSQGFALFDMNGVKRGTQYDTPIVAPRGHPTLNGQLACANAIYFRDPLIEGARPMPVEPMLKLAVIAEVHGQVEFAFELLRAAARTGDPALDSASAAEVERAAEADYHRLLAGAFQARWRNRLARSVKAVLPKAFWKAAKRLSEKAGLGSNPLYPG
jgi:FkbM family methyltransferase